MRGNSEKSGTSGKNRGKSGENQGKKIKENQGKIEENQGNCKLQRNRGKSGIVTSKTISSLLTIDSWLNQNPPQTIPQLIIS